jgi:hypothetical protein
LLELTERVPLDISKNGIAPLPGISLHFYRLPKLASSSSGTHDGELVIIQLDLFLLFLLFYALLESLCRHHPSARLGGDNDAPAIDVSKSPVVNVGETPLNKNYFAVVYTPLEQRRVGVIRPPVAD